MDAEIFTDPELKKYHGNERTEEVRDIIDRMPTKFGFWVTGIVVFIFLLLMLFGWVIRYPDIVKGQLTVNTALFLICCNLSFHHPVRCYSGSYH